MFIKNITDKNVHLRSHAGFSFSVPPGVSAIWTSAGEEMLKVHKVESKGGVEKHATAYGIVEIDQGRGMPALYEATEAEWKKGGKKFAEVQRFIVDHKLIPRAKLITVALERGIGHNRVMEYQLDTTIDTEEIAKEINELPIPEEVKYPHSIEDEENTEPKTDAANEPDLNE